MPVIVRVSNDAMQSESDPDCSLTRSHSRSVLVPGTDKCCNHSGQLIFQISNSGKPSYESNMLAFRQRNEE
jgi:hypothetical protein